MICVGAYGIQFLSWADISDKGHRLRQRRVRKRTYSRWRGLSHAPFLKGASMAQYDQEIRALSAYGREISWQGGASSSEVRKAEELLGVTLPISYRRFLREYGGGGVIGGEISGVEENDASLTFGGTIFGDTVECRRRFRLPPELSVIYFHDDEVCWCLDTKATVDDECPVVSFNIFTGVIDHVIASSFDLFMRGYFEMHSSKPTSAVA